MSSFPYGITPDFLRNAQKDFPFLQDVSAKKNMHIKSRTSSRSESFQLFSFWYLCIDFQKDHLLYFITYAWTLFLQTLRHENLVNLLEVFRRKKKLFLVFEFVDRTILDDLERFPYGLPDDEVKSISFQVLRGLEFCHSHNVSLLFH